ncbi:MAG TPA: hypothetical protein VIM49_13340 [Dermatophilaceae bacterium]
MDDTTSTVANDAGPSGWTGAVAEVDSRVAGVDAGDRAEEVIIGDTVLFDELPPWSVGDVHAASSRTIAAPHMTRWSVMFWRLTLARVRLAARTAPTSRPILVLRVGHHRELYQAR